jgi:hypothetical protein|nr:MAG TPA: putative membrane protein [Caudoviricetes sp.]
MKEKLKAILKHAVLALCGGCVYFLIEMAWRGHSHWTMAVLGGVCFVLIGDINEFIPWNMPLILQGAIGSGIVTVLELVSGIILNLWLGLGIWDYSNMPFNLLGQICLPFTLLWVALSIVAVALDDWLRYWLFGEDRPTYTLF